MFDVEGQKGERNKSNVLISLLQYKNQVRLGAGGRLSFPWDFLSER